MFPVHTKSEPVIDPQAAVNPGRISFQMKRLLRFLDGRREQTTCKSNSSGKLVRIIMVTGSYLGETRTS